MFTSSTVAFLECGKYSLRHKSKNCVIEVTAGFDDYCSGDRKIYIRA